MDKPPPLSYQPPRAAPRWMSWTVGSCLIVFLAIGLLIDLNGNLVLMPTGPLPDLLNPAPALLMLAALIAGGIISLVHAARYKLRRILWFGIALLFAILFVVTMLPPV